MNSLMFKLVLEKAEELEIKLPTSTGSWKKQESSRKASISALLTMPTPLTVSLWKILREMGIPDHLTCLLRNLYAGQKATVRTGHGKTDWFRIGKGVHQGCILSLCLFNLYAEYIMRNAGLEEAQAGINLSSLQMLSFPHIHSQTSGHYDGTFPASLRPPSLSFSLFPFPSFFPFFLTLTLPLFLCPSLP